MYYSNLNKNNKCVHNITSVKHCIMCIIRKLPQLKSCILTKATYWLQYKKKQAQ